VKHKFVTICAGAIIAAAASGVAAAGPLDDGQAAYERGDYVSALRVLRPLAEGGDARAQYMVGLAYDLGNGVPQDHAKAANWYRKAAIQGAPDARASLGALYARGQGVPQDYVQAAQWWRLVGN
jgi:TPR repeat protein